jgi:PKHD-type hydroxylase
MLLHIPQVLSSQQVRAMRAAIDAAPWEDGRATGGAQAARIKRNRQLPPHASVALEQGQVILKALAANSHFFSVALPLRTIPPFFNRYGAGETYGMHIDNAVRAVTEPWGWVRSDLSATLFLSAPDDYDGGELVVADTYGTHEIKLPAGDMIVYPAASLHRVEPVTRGERVASFFWSQSMVRDDTQRTMLFELDQTIQKLRLLHGETSEALALTNHYHNLLRMWAEV